MKLSDCKKICVVTGSRADYGILNNLIKKIKKHPKYKLQLIATGSHLSKQHGKTISEINSEGLKPDAKIQIIGSKLQAYDLIKNSTRALSGYAVSFKKLKRAPGFPNYFPTIIPPFPFKFFVSNIFIII